MDGRPHAYILLVDDKQFTTLFVLQVVRFSALLVVILEGQFMSSPLRCGCGLTCGGVDNCVLCTAPYLCAPRGVCLHHL